MATGVELATAWVRIVPSMDGVQGELTKGLGTGVDGPAEEAGKKAGQKFSTGFKLSMTLLSGAVVAGVANALGGAVTAASDLNEAGTAVGAVFGDSFSGINDWAKKAAGNIGQSQLEALNAAKSFGVFGSAAGLTNEENAKFSTGLAELASDFASFHNVSPQEAIEAIGSGLRGEAEPLRKFGVLLDDATLKAKAMEMGLYDGNGTLDQQAKILAANAVITEQAGAAQGDFARTSEGMANKQRILDASMANLAATVGTALMPVMQGLLDIAAPVVKWMTENPAIVQALAIALGVLAAAVAVATAAMWALSLTPIVALIIAIVAAVALLIAGIVLLIMNWDAVVAFISDLWAGFCGWLIGITEGLAKWWEQLWAGFGSWITKVWSGFVSWITGIWNGFIGWIMGVVNGFVGWWNGIWGGIGKVIQDVFGNIGKFIGGIWDGIVGGIRNAVNSIIRIVNGVIDGINGLVGAAGAVLGLNIRIPRIPMLADGGTLTRGGSVIVGERGPEILTLPKGAQVNPDYDSFPAEKGVTFNNYAPLGATPSQELRRFANRAKGL